MGARAPIVCRAEQVVLRKGVENFALLQTMSPEFIAKIRLKLWKKILCEVSLRHIARIAQMSDWYILHAGGSRHCIPLIL